MEVILRYTEKAPYRISATVIKVGDDLVAVVAGGDRPHVGSVAIAVPYSTISSKSGEDTEKTQSTISVYNLIGHRDDQIASPLADLIARNLKRISIVLAGIHVENAKKEDIEKILDQMSNINTKIVERLKEKDV
jgi:hypothetical protein